MNLKKIKKVNKSVGYDLRVGADGKVTAHDNMRTLLDMDDKGFDLHVDINTGDVYLEPVEEENASMWTGRGDTEKGNVFTARELVNRLNSQYDNVKKFGLHRKETDDLVVYQVTPWEEDRVRSPLEDNIMTQQEEEEEELVSESEDIGFDPSSFDDEENPFS